jgi:hypothetical protein
MIYFTSLEKNQKLKQVPVKGGLPQVPLIVGLIRKVPNGINNLIAKCVGFQQYFFGWCDHKPKGCCDAKTDRCRGGLTVLKRSRVVLLGYQ